MTFRNIDNGANKYNECLYNVCYRGHLELMIAKGAYNINSGLREACCRGYLELSQLMIDNHM